jgi:phosphoribosylanthranilate isomerase
MNAVKVKICGITREENLEAAVNAGVDAVGFVVGVPSSPRNLSLERAAELVKQVPVFTKTVLVMIPKCVDEIVEAYEAIKPDVLQIHGEGTPNANVLKKMMPGVGLIKGINPEPERLMRAAEETGVYDTLLLDTFVPGELGGTGVQRDWEMSARFREAIHPKRMILAGGLNPMNVEEAIRAVKPYAVDVSSGVESRPGLKDPDKIASFIVNVRKVKMR